MRQLLLLCFTLMITLAQANFEKGVAFYQDKQYKKAISAFQQDWDSTQNSANLYNLGLSHLMLKQPEKALYYFEKTLKYDPNNTDAIYNASHLFSEMNEGSYWQHPYSWIGRFVFKFSSNTWSYLSLFFALLLGLSIFITLQPHQRSRKKIGQFGIVITFVFLATSTLAAKFSYEHFVATEFAYLPKTDIATFISPGKNPTEVKLELNQRYKVNQQQDDFLQIQLKTGERIWVAQKDVLSY
ncbi:Tetratricopeptide repeat-containing protein [Lishizhenia tianjinensis]|uniref:Tetratricopeptide repeat-containing protein n=1 Tax=Lishizhenia tianjinensis TaxID=477690 RepID=A0A1I7A2D9_9FLAO|nr:tetratricopeptide repeat protein [Lishizhenia tianjinensis]SFT69070.1 Tetratricopeptide repeat-containing protein [Lishizhenia tianjinensis]